MMGEIEEIIVVFFGIYVFLSKEKKLEGKRHILPSSSVALFSETR